MMIARAIAATVAATVALCSAGVLGPAGTGVLLLLLPLPVLVLGGATGLAISSIAVGLSAATLAAMLGAQVGVFYLVIGGIPVILSVWALQNGQRIETAVALSAVALAAGTVLTMLWMHGDVTSLKASAGLAWDESFDQTLDLYRVFGISDEQLTDLQLQREQLLHVLLSIAPAVGLVVAGAVWLLNIRLGRRWMPWAQLYNLHQWQAPDWLIWVFIASGFALFVPIESVSLGARNIFVVVLACYFCQGLAIVSYYLQRLGLPAGLRAASYLLIGLQQIIAGLVLMLGVFDFWGDFRRLSVSAADASGGADSD